MLLCSEHFSLDFFLHCSFPVYHSRSHFSFSSSHYTHILINLI
jgi:hypothetical protein